MSRYIVSINMTLIVLLLSFSIDASTVMITGEHLNVRSGPGRTYDIIDVVHKHEQFEMLKQHDGWVQISVEGIMGWVPTAATTVMTDKTLQDLLKKADSYFQRQQFTTPADANAHDLYRQVLQIEPDNVHAQKRIQQMARTYKIWAENAKNTNDIEKAIIFYQRYVYVMPSDQEAKNALRSLDNAHTEREDSLRIQRLRSDPATLSREHIVHMIQKYHFHHPADWSKYGLSPSITGHVRHEYIMEESHGLPIITDHATQLMWQTKGPAGPMTWKHANEYAKQLNKRGVAGYTDWRLPTIEELTSLMEPRKTQSDLYLHPIFGSDVLWCWSADRSSTTNSAWYISFNSGGIQEHTINNTAFVLIVRSQY